MPVNRRCHHAENRCQQFSRHLHRPTRFGRNRLTDPFVIIEGGTQLYAVVMEGMRTSFLSSCGTFSSMIALTRLWWSCGCCPRQCSAMHFDTALIDGSWPCDERLSSLNWAMMPRVEGVKAQIFSPEHDFPHIDRLGIGLAAIVRIVNLVSRSNAERGSCRIPSRRAYHDEFSGSDVVGTDAGDNVFQSVPDFGHAGPDALLRRPAGC